MALSRTARGSVKNTSTANLSVPSFTPANGSLLIAVVTGATSDSNGTSAPAPSISGGSLTWTRRVQSIAQTGYPGWYGFAEIWTAPVSTGASMQVTLAVSRSVNGKSLNVYEYSGHDAASPTGATAQGSRAGASGSWSITLSGAPASTSEVVAAVAIDNWVTTNCITVGTGWTQLYEDEAVGSETHAQVQARGSSTSTSVTWDNVNASDGDMIAVGVALEIKEASAGGTDELTADSITANAPALGSPSLGQSHALSGVGVAAGTPTAGAPVIGQIHVLEPDDLLGASPVLGSPSLGQVHALSATGITTGAPALGTPSMTTPDALTADDIETGSPSLSAPALGQIHDLDADGAKTGVPGVATAGLGQVHALAADSVTTGSPSLGSPALEDVPPGTDALIGDDIIAEAPFFSQVSIGGELIVFRNPVASPVRSPARRVPT